MNTIAKDTLPGRSNSSIYQVDHITFLQSLLYFPNTNTVNDYFNALYSVVLQMYPLKSWSRTARIQQARKMSVEDLQLGYILLGFVHFVAKYNLENDQCPIDLSILQKMLTVDELKTPKKLNSFNNIYFHFSSTLQAILDQEVNEAEIDALLYILKEDLNNLQNNRDMNNK